MNVEWIDVSSTQWQSFLDQTPHDIYHYPTYLMLEAKRQSAYARALMISDGDAGLLLPFLQRSCNQLFPEINLDVEIFDAISPYGYSGILLNSSAIKRSDFIGAAINMIKYQLKQEKICSIFIRHHPILTQSWIENVPCDSLIENGETIAIDLMLSDEEIWQHTRSDHRSRINKGKRNQYVCKFEPLIDSSYLEEFISIYYETMSRVSARKDYFFNREYFENLKKMTQMTYLGLVLIDDEVASASLFFESCKIVQYHLSGTRTRFMKASPSSFLIDSARKWAKMRGNHWLHLGGGLGASRDSLYEFKAGFSKQRYCFWTSRWITDADHYQKLVDYREQSLGRMLSPSFFPQYRAIA